MFEAEIARDLPPWAALNHHFLQPSLSLRTASVVCDLKTNPTLLGSTSSGTREDQMKQERRHG
jgi:hypothetical protein